MTSDYGLQMGCDSYRRLNEKGYSERMRLQQEAGSCPAFFMPELTENRAHFFGLNDWIWVGFATNL